MPRCWKMLDLQEGFEIDMEGVPNQIRNRKRKVYKCIFILRILGTCKGYPLQDC